MTGPIGAGNNSLNFGGGGAITVSDKISGLSAELNLSVGSETVVLSGNNSFGGAVNVSGGVLNLRHDHALGSTDAGVTFLGGGGRVELQDNIAIAGESLAVIGTGNGLGALRSLSGNNAWIGPITLGGPTKFQVDADTLTLNSLDGRYYGLTLECGGNITMTGCVSGSSASLAKSGAGTLTLTASNSFGGATTISNGVLNLRHPNALGSTDSGTEVKAGGALEVQGSLAIGNESLTLNGSGTGSGALLSVSGNNSWAGALALAGPAEIRADADSLTLGSAISGGGYGLTLSGTGNMTFNGGLSGAGTSFNKISSGSLTLTAESSFDGPANLNAGVTFVTINNALGSAASGTFVQNLAALDLRGGVNYSTPEPLSLMGSGPDATGVLYSPDGSNTFAGPVTLSIASTIGVASNACLVLNGQITGGGGLTKSGTGTLTLNALNNYSRDTYINAGVLIVSSDSALGTPTAGTHVTDNATLAIRGGITYATPEALTISGSGAGGVGAFTALDGDNTFAGSVTLSANSTISAAAGTALTLMGNLSGGPTTTLTKNGPGKLTLAMGNSYSGPVEVQAGTLALTMDKTLGTTDQGTRVHDGAALQLRNNVNYTKPEPLTIAGTGPDGSGALASPDGINSFAGPVTLDADSIIGVASGATLTLNGVINGSSALTKSGNGVLTLSAPNLYGGNTAVEAGTLRVANASGSATGFGSVSITANATLTGGGRIDGAVTISGRVAPGSSIGILATGSETWSSGGSYTWEINDATGTPGSSPGWDLLSVNGNLDVQATPADPFTIKIVSLRIGMPGLATNFNNGSNYAWAIATASGGVLNFDANKFVVNTLSFSNDTAGGAFLVDTGSVCLRFTNNHAPVANVCTAGRRAGEPLRLSIATLLVKFTSDPDGDDRALFSVSPASTNGGSVTLDSQFITYTPTNDAPDAFTYTVRDLRSSYRPWDTVQTSTATILVSVTTNQSLNIVGIETLGDGNKRVTFAGIPACTYLVQGAPNLDSPIFWETLSTNTAGTNGFWIFTDLTATNCLQRYYRSTEP